MRVYRLLVMLLVGLCVSGYAVGADATGLVDKPLTIGVHYWGNAWPINFWNTLERSRVRADFQKIRRDGFNTVILAVPWSEFCGVKQPTVLRDRPAALLSFLLDEAAAAGLKVALRVSYLWDYSDPALPSDVRFVQLFEDRSKIPQWGDYLAAVYAKVHAHPAFAFAFITWEDFMLPQYFMDGAEPKRLKAAADCGFQQYLKGRYSLAVLHALYGREFENYQQVPLPEARSTASVLFYDFWDDWLVNVVFAEASKRFPNISMECRLDWDGSAIPGKTGWVFNKHEPHYKLRGTDWVVTYYGPYMFARNEGEVNDAATAGRLFSHQLDHVKTFAEGRKIFIDQFNFQDNTVGFSRNAKIDPTQIEPFLVLAADQIRQKTTGYALWAWEDYICSNLYNASFEADLEGWQTAGHAEIVPNGVDRSLRMRPGDSISQVISDKPQWTDIEWVQFEADPGAGQTAVLQFSSVDQSTEVRIDTAGTHRANLKVLPRKAFSVRCVSGTVTLDDLLLGGHTQHMGFRNNDGSPSDAYRGIVQMNQRLAEPSP